MASLAFESKITMLSADTSTSAAPTSFKSTLNAVPAPPAIPVPATEALS